MLDPPDSDAPHHRHWPREVQTCGLRIRIDRGALRVLQWEAKVTGVPLGTRVREMIEVHAEDVSQGNGMRDLAMDYASIRPRATVDKSVNNKEKQSDGK
jgi:hypothetical protein